MPTSMEAIRERLSRIEVLIGSIEKGEDHSILDKPRETIESAERVESLYINLALQMSHRLDVVEESIAILYRAVTNTHNGVSHSKPKLLKPKPSDREISSKEFGIFPQDMEQYFNRDKIGVADQVNIIAMYLMGGARLR